MTSTYCTLTAYRGRDDTQTLNSTTFNYNQNTNWSQAVNVVFRIRMETEEQNNKLFQNYGYIELSWNGGAWNQITTSSSIVRAVASSQFTDGAATTNILTVATNPFAGGEGTHDAVPTAINVSAQQVEHEYSLQIIGTDVANSDTIAIRPSGLSGYTIYPTVTVLKGASITTNGATQALTSDNIALVQHQALVTNDAAQVLTSDNIDLSQSYTLTISDATQALTSDNILVTAHLPPTILTSNDATQLLSSDNVIVVGHIPTYQLVMNDATQALTSDSISLSLALNLVSNDSTQLLTSENITLVQNYLLAVDDSTQLLNSDNVSITYHPPQYSLTIYNSAQALTSENILLTNMNIVLVMFNAIQTLYSDNIFLGGGGCTRQMMHYKRLRSKL